MSEKKAYPLRINAEILSAAQRWADARVLNLFAYTGTLGLAAEAGGAGLADVGAGQIEFLAHAPWTRGARTV